MEPYCHTGCYADKAWMPTECGNTNNCTKGCGSVPDGTSSGSSGAGDDNAKGAKGASGTAGSGADAGKTDGPTGEQAASEFVKEFGAAKPDVAKIETGDIANQLRKFMKD